MIRPRTSFEDFLVRRLQAIRQRDRRPRLDYESYATALDRNELGALLAAARLARSSPSG
jgi:hypothetical protein